MKVKLTTSERNKILNYINIDFKDISNLDNNSCFEIYCDEEVIKQIPNEEAEKFIQVCCSKIRHGGELVVCGVETPNICLDYIYGLITESDVANKIQNSYGLYSCETIKELIKKNNLKISNMDIKNNTFTVRGYRE